MRHFFQHVSYCFLILFSLFAANNAHAIDYVTSYTQDGKPFFAFQVYQKGETNPYGSKSDWNMSPAMQKAVALASGYFVNILAPASRNQEPLVISVGSLNINNAFAYSPHTNDGYTLLSKSIITGQIKEDTLAMIQIGDTVNLQSYELSPARVLPANGNKENLSSGTVIHELGHALGIAADVERSPERFSNTLSYYAQHLYDQRGNQAKPGQNIVWELSQANNENFLVVPDIDALTGKFGGTMYFRGPETDAVLNGAILKGNLAGMPINAWEGDSLEASHLELRNSLMSHQSYRNYGVFMEAELALLQDIGYTLDRRNFFGASEYRDGQTYTNTNGYFARKGGEYEYNVPNTSSLGIGFHLYGSFNTIRQQASLLADGAGAVGVRIDGFNNTYTIAPDTRVTANGSMGTGLMVTYGLGHVLHNQGTIQATGPDGVAVRFDFGSNVLSNTENRGSYIHQEYNGSWIDVSNPLDDMEGALVDAFYVSGNMAGSAAAIYISDNALVKNIYILPGASINGNILSDWNPATAPLNPNYSLPAMDEMKTSLVFGQAHSRAASAPFSMVYNGRIGTSSGSGNTATIAMAVNSGTLLHTGTADILSLQVAQNATLMGNGVYNIGTVAGFTSSGKFTSLGSLAPRGSNTSLGTMQVNLLQNSGVFQHSGPLAIRFDAAGNTDILEINGGNSASGSLSNALEISPLQAYYRNGQGVAFATDNIFKGNALPVLPVYTDAQVTLPVFSPTLQQTFFNVNSGVVSLGVSRAPHAYSQYALSSDGHAVGQALYGISNAPVTGSLQQVFSLLDFSAIDGSAIGSALNSLSPRQDGIGARAIIDAQKQISTSLLGNLLSGSNRATPYGLEPTNAAGNVLTLFALPFGTLGSQMQAKDVAGYNTWQSGVLGGVQWRNPNYTFGLHASFSHLELTGRNNSGNSLKEDSVALGLHGRYAPEYWAGGHVYGLARLGLENARQVRDVRVAGQAWQNKGEWTGMAGTALFGAGYDILAGAVTLGVLAEVDYTRLQRPAFTEHGSPSALHLQAKGYNSLRSGIGGRLAYTAMREDNTPLGTLDISIRWNHEYFDVIGSTRASFVGNTGYNFTAGPKNPARDSLALAASLQGNLNDNVRLSLQTGGELFRGGYQSIWINAGVEVRF